MKYLVLLICLFAVACGDDVKFTWGDISEELSVAYCEAGSRCGYSVDSRECILHTHFHLCVLEDTCSEKVDRAYAEELDYCVSALSQLSHETIEASNGCYLLGWGVLPEECNFIWDVNPSSTSSLVEMPEFDYILESPDVSVVE